MVSTDTAQVGKLHSYADRMVHYYHTITKEQNMVNTFLQFPTNGSPDIQKLPHHCLDQHSKRQMYDVHPHPHKPDIQYRKIPSI